jgi:hypothetical protein
LQDEGDDWVGEVVHMDLDFSHHPVWFPTNVSVLPI